VAIERKDVADEVREKATEVLGGLEQFTFPASYDTEVLKDMEFPDPDAIETVWVKKVFEKGVTKLVRV
jgi:hypothetical protein